jgi:hypothetical protein
MSEKPDRPRSTKRRSAPKSPDREPMDLEIVFGDPEPSESSNSTPPAPEKPTTEPPKPIIFRFHE